MLATLALALILAPGPVSQEKRVRVDNVWEAVYPTVDEIRTDMTAAFGESPTVLESEHFSIRGFWPQELLQEYLDEAELTREKFLEVFPLVKSYYTSGGGSGGHEKTYKAPRTFDSLAIEGPWTLRIEDQFGEDTGALESWTLKLRTLPMEDTGGWITVPWVGSPLPIPDYPAEAVTSEIRVGKTGQVSNLQVSVELSHTHHGDLKVWLEHGSGTRILLHNSTGAWKTVNFYMQKMPIYVLRGSADRQKLLGPYGKRHDLYASRAWYVNQLRFNHAVPPPVVVVSGPDSWLETKRGFDHSDLRSAMVHHLGHVFIHIYKAGAFPPGWLDLATTHYLQGSIVISSTSYCGYTGGLASDEKIIPGWVGYGEWGKNLHRGRLDNLPHLRELMTMSEKTMNTRDMAKAWAFLIFAKDNYGEALTRYAAIVSLNEKSRARNPLLRSPVEALETAFGKDADALETEWRAWLENMPLRTYL